MMKLILLVTFIFSFGAVSQDVFTATSEDLNEFDQILENQPLPENLQKQADKENNDEEVDGKKPRRKKGELTLREQFEGPSPTHHTGIQPPPDHLKQQQEQTLRKGTERHHGTRHKKKPPPGP